MNVVKKNASEDLRKLGVNVVTAGSVGFAFEANENAALVMVCIGLTVYLFGLFILVKGGE
jgi:hypothetical protein